MWKVALLAIALTAVTVAACGGDESLELETVPLPTAPDDPSAPTFSREGYSFSHPQDWEWAGESSPSTGTPIVFHALLARGPWPTPETLRVTVWDVPLMIEFARWDEGEDTFFSQEDYLETVAEVPRRVTANNLGEFAEWRVPKFMLAYEHVREDPSATTVDGLPALYLVAEGTDVAGNEIVSQSVLVFDGETEYEIDCQYSPAKEDDMRPGCAQVFNTFRVD